MEHRLEAVQTHGSQVVMTAARAEPGGQGATAAAGRKGVLLPLVRVLCSPAVRVADMVSLSAALLVALFSPALEQGETLAGFFAMRVSVRSLAIELLMLVIWRLLFWATGMYQPRLNRSASAFLWRVPVAVALCAATLGPLLFLEHEPAASAVRAAFVFWFTGTTLMFTTRAGYFTYNEYVRPMLRPRRNIVVVGTGPRASAMTRALAAHPDFCYQLAGFVDTDPQPECARLATLLGGVDDLEVILMRQPIDEVLIALPIKSRFSEIQQVVAICGRAGIQAQYSLDLFTTEVAKHHATDESTGVRVVEMVHSDQRLLLKSALDRLVAMAGLFFLSPLLLLIAAAVKFTSKGPVFFVQKRWGKNKRTFEMIKFRSMVVDAEELQAALESQNEFAGPMFKMRRDPRVTRVGGLLRRTSLDELPQLINVLLGDMSLVGPRPLPTRDVERFSEPWLMRRFSVKPGITGLWQVSGRSNTDFDQTIRLDLRYIDRWSLLLDVKILLRTFSAVFKGRGAF